MNSAGKDPLDQGYCVHCLLVYKAHCIYSVFIFIESRWQRSSEQVSTVSLSESQAA